MLDGKIQSTVVVVVQRKIRTHLQTASPVKNLVVKNLSLKK